MQIKSEIHHALSEVLSTKHDVILEMIGNRPFHYVDIPIYGNIGDMLIMHGTLAFFRKAGLAPKSIAPYFAFDPKWVENGDVIVFQGGGNFGDIYPAHQHLREKVAQLKRNNKIIILPQTIYFASSEKRIESARIFRAHPDVHLCVRDRVSFEMAKEFTDNAYLLPDMAHQLYPIVQRSAPPTREVLYLSRVDDEKQKVGNLFNSTASTIIDWVGLIGFRKRRISLFRRIISSLFRIHIGRFSNNFFIFLWIGYSGKLVADAVKLFLDHQTIVTDRLHGHILACLLEKPNTVIDNSYGKNFEYIKVWTAMSALVTWKVNPDY